MSEKEEEDRAVDLSEQEEEDSSEKEQSIVANEDVPEKEELVIIDLKNPVPGLPNLIVPPISKEQEELLNTPVDQIPESKLFTWIPMEARLAA